MKLKSRQTRRIITVAYLHAAARIYTGRRLRIRVRPASDTRRLHAHLRVCIIRRRWWASHERARATHVRLT